MTIVRAIALLVAVSGVTLGAGAVIGKAVLVHAAEEKARHIVNGLNVRDQSIDTAAIQVTHQVHRWYAQDILVDGPPLLFRLRPYLTHDLVPAIFRLPQGLIDTLYAEGECDSAARTLGYILETTGIRSRQLNIVNRFVGGHSVVLARFPDGREVMLDPHFGIVPQLDGELLSPEKAREASMVANPHGDIWHELAPTSDDWFYRKFEHAVFAVQDTGLDIAVPVKLPEGRPLALGRRDGDSGDVRRDGSSHDMTPYWHYLGHKYDRGWTRVLQFAQDTRVEIGLTEPVDAELITTDALPRIDGDTLVYVVAADESLAFVDGLAKRDWTRLKSYRDIDYILFEPVP